MDGELSQSQIKAKQALSKIQKSYLDELKAFANPPKRVKIIGCLIPIFLFPEQSLQYKDENAQYMKFTKLRHNFYQFMKQLQNFDVKGVPKEKITGIEKILEENNMQETNKSSLGMGYLYEWMRAMLEWSKEN